MESFGSRLAILVLLNAGLLLLSVPAVNSDEDDNLLQGINSFRQSANAPPLTKHDKAECVADQIADQLQDQHCTSTPPTQSQLMSNYPNVLRKCKIDVNTTTDGMILPVCVPHRVSTLVLTNYTQSRNSQYLNSSRFTGAGIGTEDDWTVLVLTTGTTGGSFASTSCLSLVAVSAHYILSLYFILFLLFLY
ncbi:hypothetical protein CASFOL_024638 [Castilleja foliolosa]|uniref:Uncharacterized GPI-anchored protein At5g19230-like domain-containing protein n=1 Tax=Castilleja foliolosa TaxID=1961234 RepID=A0ABD3CRA1_9LAMI